MSDRIANIGAGIVPTYHATESVEEAKAVVEQCKTSTERLRTMLDERGVKWKRKRGRKHDGTEWYDQFGVYAEAVQEYSWDGFEHPEGKLLVRRGMGYLTHEQAIAATLGAGTCKEVYLLMAIDIGDGREEVLGVYATEEAAMAAINENQFGYAFHHVLKQEVAE